MSSNGWGEICPRGVPLHYSSPFCLQLMKAMVLLKGYYVTVRVGVRRWKVPRHYIALRGLNPEGLPGLGFEELPSGEE